MNRTDSDPAMRLRRAAGQLQRSADQIEHIAEGEGIQVPAEVGRAASVIRAWCRTFAAPPRPTRVQQLLAQSAESRRSHS